MALADILKACTDENRRGGLKRLFFVDRTILDTLSNADTTLHQYDSVTLTPTTEDWNEIEAEDFEAEINSEGANENGSAVFTNTLEAFIPKIESTKAKKLQDYVTSCKVIIIAETYNLTSSGNNIAILLGYDDLLKKKAAMRINLNTNTGRALEDANRYVLSATGKSAETPRIFSGTIDVSGAKTVDFS